VFARGAVFDTGTGTINGQSVDAYFADEPAAGSGSLW
jgi:hypothetical protein